MTKLSAPLKAQSSTYLSASMSHREKVFIKSEVRARDKLKFLLLILISSAHSYFYFYPSPLNKPFLEQEHKI